MSNKVKPIPDGYHTVTPYLIIKDTASAIEFYKKAFGATEMVRMAGPDGKIMHAEIKIGDSPIMMSDGGCDQNTQDPLSLGGSPITLMLYVPDVDSFFARAVAEGAKVSKPVQDQFYGDRSGTLSDAYGHIWHIATHMEDVSPEEMQRRSEDLFSAKT